MKVVKGWLNFYQGLLHFYLIFFLSGFASFTAGRNNGKCDYYCTQEDKTFCLSLYALLNFI